MKKLLLAALAALAFTAPVHAEAVRPFVRGSWAKLTQAHAGEPTVIHFWGLTCGPCLAELPHWAQLVRERPDLHLVLIAADPVLEKPAGLSKFLDRMGLSDVESWGFADSFTDRLEYEIDPHWHGELPRTMLIAANGKMTLIDGVSDPGKIRAWLDAQKALPSAVR